ncbi:MAG: hypothetical protein ACRD9S_04890 [Pyrinomonadaceae bacterium]
MKSIILKSLAAALVLTVAVSVIGLAQRNHPTASTNAAPGLLFSLPPSDAVAVINSGRVFNEVLPKLLAENPAKLAEVTSELVKFKTQTGLDPHSFEQIALGLSYKYPREGVTKVSTVALARGTFNAGAMVAAGRLATNGKYVEQKYQGKTIYIFSLDRQLRLLGLWNMNVRDLAVSALDSNTLVLGDLEAVRGSIDATRTGKRPSAELLALASRDPNAIVGFGGNVSPKLLENLSLSNDTIARELTAVRQLYGTLGMTSVDLELMLTARTVDTYSAKNLSDTVEGLKQLGGLFINRLTGAKGTLARSALDNLKATTTGNELQVRTAVAQSQVAPLLK